jgi:formylglycine-generating enzyme required for sulfatase activity
VWFTFRPGEPVFLLDIRLEKKKWAALLREGETVRSALCTRRSLARRIAPGPRRLALLLLGLASILGAPAPSAGVVIEWVEVGDPGNAADSPSSNCFAASCGSVGYAYFISKYEVTNAQYAEFLNAVDPGGSNPLALYNAGMNSDPSNGGISLVPGNPSGSKYEVKSGFASKPVTYVSFYDALRFANWLHNGQGAGSTETGAYTLLGGTATPSNGFTVTREPGAITFLPSENEWYKAAYFNGTSYFDYPAGTDTPTVCAAPTAAANSASCDAPGSDVSDPDVDRVTDVGSFPGSASPYGTFDQGGNVWEWNEQIVGGLGRGIRGGGWDFVAGFLAASYRGGVDPSGEGDDVGFRVASLVPEPGTGLLVMTGILGLAARRRCPAKAGAS